MAQKQILKNWLQLSSLRLSRIRYVLIAIFVGGTLTADAWHLIPPGTVLQRWTYLGILGIVNTVFWYLSRSPSKSEAYYKLLIIAQIAVDILMISLFIYSQRGIASRGVALYALPIVASAVLLTRSAIYATATMCASAYALTAIRYQFLHPGEAYKVELYSELFVYCAIFFLIAAILQIIIRSKNATSK